MATSKSKHYTRTEITGFARWLTDYESRRQVDQSPFTQPLPSIWEGLFAHVHVDEEGEIQFTTMQATRLA